MGAYLLRRLIGTVPLILGISVLLFALIHLPPGGPMDIYAMLPDVRAADLERLKENMGLNEPLPVQYVKWFTGLLRGDWGRSYRDGSPVTSAILERLPATLELMFSSALIAICCAIPLGIFTATRAHSKARYLIDLLSMLGISVPTFWTGLMVIMVFAGQLRWLPTGGRGDGGLIERAHHLIGPALVLATASVASWTRFVHASMIEVLRADYVRTARAKGLGERTVIYRHAFRNACMPIITLLGLEMPRLVSGALVTEVIFSWPGIGRLITESILARDYPVLMGAFILSAMMVILGNLIADLLYGLVNPQVRY